MKAVEECINLVVLENSTCWNYSLYSVFVQGKWFTGGVQFTDTEHFLDSVSIRNRSIVEGIYIPNYNTYKNQWRSDAEMQRHYWAATLLLPIGSIFILAVVVLLMVLFKRCPYMVAAIVAGILGIIIIFATLVSLNHTPIYS